ncbi:NUDIX hydrolase [Roseiterribacter gracilis]|uniref:DNA mismatch repair protein MutT n=1 Tax=Roseiterribacter gracilis TaxID=2812848 RepID=A0A8S8X8P9_9PROT|nr:DNA mismatch repair protein MutT [Rhodospirillales bacterium TMPK1]
MNREYPTRPWVGVGVVVRRGDRVLLVRRSKAPRKGEWSIPGGAIDLGETTIQAAAREVREETGLDVTPTKLLTTVDAIQHDAQGQVAFHYVLIDYLARADDDQVAVAGDDVDAVQWATLDEAVALLPWQKTRDLIRQALTEV